jgi:hypothetical protein
MWQIFDLEATSEGTPLNYSLDEWIEDLHSLQVMLEIGYKEDREGLEDENSSDKGIY